VRARDGRKLRRSFRRLGDAVAWRDETRDGLRREPDSDEPVEIATAGRDRRLTLHALALGPDQLVYVIRQAAPDGPFKIGHCACGLHLGLTLKPIVRASPHDIEIWRILPGLSLADERRLQDRFSAHQMKGEWFRPAPEVVAFAVGGFPGFTSSA
jgi:hypothetical protein